MEYTALKMLIQIAQKQLQDGVQLWLIGMNPGVFAIVRRSPLGEILPREAMHANLEIAVRRYLSDHELCNLA